jgi:hypothetical protein
MTRRLLNTQRIVNLASDPGSGTVGEVYYNTGVNALKVYTGSLWSDIGGSSFPDQTGQSGKFLSTNGTSPSWNSVTKTTVGLANVENTALSTWSGSTNITTLGTIATGTWQGSSIATAYTAAKVVSVNGSTGTITGLATLASPTFTGTLTASTAAFTGNVNINNNTSTRPSSGSGLTINWNWTGGQAEVDFWNVYTTATSSFVFKQLTGASTHTDLLTILPSGNATFAGTVITPAATTSLSPIRIPHGTAPTSPTNGDIWTTTTGLFARINGGTVGPYGIGTARTFYQTSAPSTPTTGDIWVDSDEVYTTINPNDYALKTDLSDAGLNAFFLSGM